MLYLPAHDVIVRGSIDADPCYRNRNQSACTYCDYAAACHFEECLGDRRRYLYPVKGTEFWERVSREEAGPGGRPPRDAKF